jgi:hypothetical protein
MGTLSALPIISAGNICCCLWVVSGGLVASYVLQQNDALPVTPGDGALVGLLAGLTGALIYLTLSIPISILMGPMELLIMERLAQLSGTMPPDFRGYMGGIGRGIGLLLGFILMLFLGSMFSTLGGILGVAIFRRSPPPVTIDLTPPDPPRV